MEVDEYVDLETTSGDEGVEGNDDESQNAINPAAEQAIECFKQSRYKRLGFHPQKEIYCNKYLPYAEQLDDESQRMLIEIKCMLGKTVALREMTPGIGIAMGKLLW